MGFVLIILGIWFLFWVAKETWIYIVIFFITPCLLIYLLFYCGIIGWIITAGIIYYFAYCKSLSDKESKKNKKIIAKKIYDIERSHIVFVKSIKQYAIPLYVSTEGVSVLQPSLRNSTPPTVFFSEEKHLLSNILLIDENSKNIELHTVDQISSIAKDLYLNIEPQREDLKIKLSELKKLEKLASFSELYKRQADLYSRASNQVEELLNANEKLSRECHAFIIDILIGQELIKYDTNNIPDVLEIKINLDYRCKQVSEQYQILRSEMDEYANLKQ